MDSFGTVEPNLWQNCVHLTSLSMEQHKMFLKPNSQKTFFFWLVEKSFFLFRDNNNKRFFVRQKFFLNDIDFIDLGGIIRNIYRKFVCGLKMFCIFSKSSCVTTIPRDKEFMLVIITFCFLFFIFYFPLFNNISFESKFKTVVSSVQGEVVL